MKRNKGEWSELYAILYLICNRKLNIADHHLKIISTNMFSVENIILKSTNNNIKISLQSDKYFNVISNDNITEGSIDEIKKLKEILFTNIKSAKKNTFENKDITNWLACHNLTNFKGESKNKADMFLINFDINRDRNIILGYSVKSKLGRPATILNSSKQTNFRYIVENLTKKQIDAINNINTRTKLKDRMAKISEYGGKIIFDRVVSNIFDYNLKMIDIGLSSALGEALLSSYKHNEKNLNKLFTESTIYNNKTLALKKLEDFLMAASFGMFPGSVWAGNYEANGGLIVVEENSEVYVIDMVYFSDEIKKFLVAESRLDTPSSSRYNMLELIEENDKIYFTLNLQVRYY